LDEIIAEFADLDTDDRRTVLLEFGNALPPLPDKYRAALDDKSHLIRECQAPVFIWVELVEGKIHIYADVGPDAPTAKGFVSILVNAFSGETPQAILERAPDLLAKLGLVKALGMQRLRGLSAIQYYVMQQVRNAAGG
jgi:cysteine desulfuration protein SufE